MRLPRIEAVDRVDGPTLAFQDHGDKFVQSPLRMDNIPMI